MSDHNIHLYFAGYLNVFLTSRESFLEKKKLRVYIENIENYQKKNNYTRIFQAKYYRLFGFYFLKNRRFWIIRSNI